MTRHRRFSQRGFTLIEITLVIAISTVLMTSLGIEAQNQYKATVGNRNSMVAYNLARDQMALLGNLDYPAVTAETALTPDSDFPDFIPTLEVTEIDSSGSHSLRQICLRIRLGSAAGPVLITLYTLRSDIVTFGDGV